MVRDVIPLGSSAEEPTEPLNGDEEWLGGAGVAEDGTLREAGDEPQDEAVASADFAGGPAL